MAQKIGLFGGTFDPVHTGHISLVNSFTESGIIDELWILPTPDPPHKTDQHITPFEHRKKMLEIVFKNAGQVHIDETEQKLPLPSYTIQTIQYLKQRHPELEFYLCIGQDSLANFDSWYKADRIVEECELLVAERPDSSTNGVEDKYLERSQFVTHTPVDVSSSDLRVQLRNNPEEMGDEIPDEVLDYIRKNELYQNRTDE